MNFGELKVLICDDSWENRYVLSMLMKKVQQGQGNAAILEQFGKVLAFNKGKGFCNLIAMPGPPIESALKLFPDDFQALAKTA